jgi:hypothetical protein
VNPAPTGVVVAQAGVIAVTRPNVIAVQPTAVLFGYFTISIDLLYIDTLRVAYHSG